MSVETINPATGQVEYRHELMAPDQVEAVLAACRGELRHTQVQGPLGEPVMAAAFLPRVSCHRNR